MVWRVAAVLAVSASLVRAQDFTLSEEQFNSWITNGQDSAEQRIEAQLAVQMRSLMRICKLTPDQERKLRLAADGDIQRFQARVAEVHDRLVGRTYNQNEINNLWQQIQPLQQELPRVLGPQSLFNKVKRRTLQEGQRADYDRVLGEQMQFRYQAKVQLFVTAFDRAAPMTEKQRVALYKLIVDTTHRPQRFGQYDWYYVIVQAAKTPEAKYAEILDKAQVAALMRAFQQARGYENMLEREGIVPVEESERPVVESAGEPQAADAAPGGAAIEPEEGNAS